MSSKDEREHFWRKIERQLWDMIAEINEHYYSRPHDVDNFAYQLAASNKHDSNAKHCLFMVDGQKEGWGEHESGCTAPNRNPL